VKSDPRSIIIIILESNPNIRYCLKRLFAVLNYILNIQFKTISFGRDKIDLNRIPKGDNVAIIADKYYFSLKKEFTIVLKHLQKETILNFVLHDDAQSESNEIGFFHINKSSLDFVRKLFSLLEVNFGYYSRKSKDQVIKIGDFDFGKKCFLFIISFLINNIILISDYIDSISQVFSSTKSFSYKLITFLNLVFCHIYLLIFLLPFGILTFTVDMFRDVNADEKKLHYNFFSSAFILFLILIIVISQIIIAFTGRVDIGNTRINSVFNSGRKQEIIDQNLIQIQNFDQDYYLIEINRNIEFDELGSIEIDIENIPKEQLLVQLSPNNQDWYYFSNSSNKWKRTQRDYVSSNNLDEINYNLNRYGEETGSNSVFIRAFVPKIFFTEQKKVNQAIINYFIYPVSFVNLKGTVVPTPIPTSLSQSLENTLPVPKIQSVLFKDGNKLISGIIPANIFPRDLLDYEVEVYYSNNQNTPEAGKFIGKTNLFLVNEIPKFELISKENPGGYIIAKLLDKKQEKESAFSIPTRSEIITVNTTKDLDSVSLEKCITVENTCSLRAAIEYVNNSMLEHEIRIEIGADDENYLDYDLPFDQNSGDSLGDDDYWNFEMNRSLPQIQTGMFINGHKDSLQPMFNLNFTNSDNAFEINMKNPNANFQIRGFSINGFNKFAIFQTQSNARQIIVRDIFFCSDIKGRKEKGGEFSNIELITGANIINNCN
jgi:CSLREA domain-containing protein